MALSVFQIAVSFALLWCSFHVAALSIWKPESELAASNDLTDKFVDGITELDVQAQLDAREMLRAKGQLLQSGRRPGSANTTVCVSLPVFEMEPSYIEELLNNFMFFTEPTTKVALHFDANTKYTEETMTRFNGLASDRVALTRTRIPMRKFGGSILYVHLLNSRTLEETWPGVCKFFAMQASNMWWVRKGMEASIRKHGYAQLAVQPKSLAANSGPFWHELLPKALNGWGQPEGAFFPMRMVRHFNKYADAWLSRTHQTYQAILDVKIDVEAFWLPTYALNFAKDIPEKSVGGNFALCYRHMVDSSKNDSVPIEEIKDLIAGEKFIHDTIDNKLIPAAPFYAVKRVNRDLNHPTTKFVVSLSY